MKVQTLLQRDLRVPRLVSLLHFIVLREVRALSLHPVEKELDLSHISLMLEWS